MKLAEFLQQLDDNAWLLGGTMLVERDRCYKKEQNILKEWRDNSDWIRIRRLAVSPSFKKSCSSLVVYPDQESIILDIGEDTTCHITKKVAGLSSEGHILAQVKNLLPLIPIPEVHYSNDDDPEWECLFVKRVPGQCLQFAWPTLSREEREKILQQTADYIHTMAGMTSRRLCGLGGEGINDPYLWRQERVALHSMIASEARRYFRDGRRPACWPPGESMGVCVQHPELAPVNIMVEDGRLVCIVGWRVAGYYPRFWVATKPLISPLFNLNPGPSENEWREGLLAKLTEKDYPNGKEWYQAWKSTRYWLPRHEEEEARIAAMELETFHEKFLAQGMLTGPQRGERRTTKGESTAS